MLFNPSREVMIFKIFQNKIISNFYFFFFLTTAVFSLSSYSLSFFNLFLQLVLLVLDCETIFSRFSFVGILEAWVEGMYLYSGFAFPSKTSFAAKFWHSVVLN